MVTERDPGPDYERLLLSKLGSQRECRLVRHKLGIERLLSFVGAGLGLTLVAEGATGAAHPGVAYREVQDGDGPTRLNFVAYWRQANRNPTLAPFLDLLRERYPDLSAPGAPAEED
nr:LysR substrate-binding domain-containing protein [Methylocella tundrae]